MENKFQYHIFSPYRVCPLGAHVDHQHGLVTGFAIDKGIDLWFNINEEGPLRGEMKQNLNNSESNLNNFQAKPASNSRSILNNSGQILNNFQPKAAPNSGSILNNSSQILNNFQPKAANLSHVHLESRTFEGTVDFDLDAPTQVRERHWGDYARGAKYALKKRFELKRGITGVIQGSLPIGGLSSSAAVLIAYVMAFAKANDIILQPFEIVKIASEAEREYIGLNNGLLDQACIALGKKNQLLFLDCDTNEYRLIPFGGAIPNTPSVIPNRRSSESKAMLASAVPSRDGGRQSHGVEGSHHAGQEISPCASLSRDDNASIIPNAPSVIPNTSSVIPNTPSVIPSEVEGSQGSHHDNRDDKSSDLPFEIGIFFSGLTRSLVNSDYNLRVYECKTAAWNMLAYTDQPLKTFDKTFLRDIPKATFDKTRNAMPARFARRAEHFYSEYRRVRQGVTAWESGNLKLFGKLSFDSCESSIHNYECGSPELIAIYEIMRSLPGVYGGRFSGAGFKGACIALVDPAYKDSIESELTSRYLAQFPEYERTFQVFWVRPDNGARFID